MHREDVKAGLRKRFKSLGAFEKAHRLPRGSVNDILRGRASAVTERAISEALDVPLHDLFPRRYPSPMGDASSVNTDDSTPAGTFHRLTEVAG